MTQGRRKGRKRTGRRVELLGDLVSRALELLEQVGADGEEVNTREGLDLANLYFKDIWFTFEKVAGKNKGDVRCGTRHP